MSEGLSLDSIKRLREQVRASTIMCEPIMPEALDEIYYIPIIYRIFKCFPIMNEPDGLDPRKQTKRFYMDIDKKHKARKC